MEKVDLIYKLNGNFEDGINVFESAPVWLSIGSLIYESRKILCPDRPPFSVNVRPCREGYFDIQIVLHQASNFLKILDIIRPPGGNEIKELLQSIGLITTPITATGIGDISLLKLLRWLRGKPKGIEKTNTLEVKYIDNNGVGISVNPKIHALYQNISIQQNIYNGIIKSFNNKHVKNVECFIKDDPDTRETFERDIVATWRQYANGKVPSVPDASPEGVTENVVTRRLWVHPKRINCEGEPNSWSFRIPRSDETLKVIQIKDEQFLQNIKDGRFRLAKTDQLYIEVQEKQKTEGNKASGTYEITKVIEYIKYQPPHQKSFLPDKTGLEKG